MLDAVLVVNQLLNCFKLFLLPVLINHTITVLEAKISQNNNTNINNNNNNNNNKAIHNIAMTTK